MLCLQYVFYSLLPIGYIMWHQNNSQTPQILPRRDRAPVLKFLDPPLAIQYGMHCTAIKSNAEQTSTTVNKLNAYLTCAGFKERKIF